MASMNPEQLLLAWIFLKPKQADEVYARVQAKHFAAAINAEAFAKAREISAKGQQADPFSVSQVMETADAFNYLLSLCNLPVGQNLDAVIDAVKDQGARTRLRVTLESALLTLNDHATSEDAYTEAKKAIDSLGEDSTKPQDDAKLMRELLPDYVAELQRRSSSEGELLGLSTGFRDLDKILNGLKPGNMIVVAGRPSMGKSTFALNIAQHNAKAGKSVVVFSMEMCASDITDKLVSADTGVFLGRIQSGEVVDDDRDMDQVTRAITDLQKSKLWLDTRGALTIEQVRASCFRIQRKHGLDLVVVDYIGLMRGEGNGRYEQITSLSNSLQRLSRDMGVPVIVLSQLSRGVESRSDKRPVMSDLRESGAIEQDADVIIFPYRDAYYEEKSTMRSGAFEISEIVVAKNKMGQRESAFLVWQGSMSRFVDDNSGVDWKGRPKPGKEEKRTYRKKGMLDA